MNPQERRLPPRLIWISPGRGLGEELFGRLAACTRAGLRGFQLRERLSFPRDLGRFARRARSLLPKGEGHLVINDRLDVAQAAGADGVHLGGRSLSVAEARRLLGSEPWIGRSVHDEAELAEAVDGGADYVYVSPVFPLRKGGRPGPPPLGLLGLSRLVGLSSLPVLALGGITPERVPELLHTGIHGVAVQGALARSEDPAPVVHAFLEVLP